MANIKIRSRHFKKSAGVLVIVAVAVGILSFGNFNQTSQAAGETITPNQGSTAGGTVVTITGDFTPSPRIQSFTPDDCRALPMYDRFNPNSINSINSTLIRRDDRDNQLYTIRRLQDGRCWMIDNLKLELGVSNAADPTKDTKMLEPANTNVAQNTPVYFTQDGTQNGAPMTGMVGNFTTTGYNTRDGTRNQGDRLNPNADAWRQNDPSAESYCRGDKADEFVGSEVTLNAIGSLTMCGYLYNFYTATAGSVPQDRFGIDYPPFHNSTNSICPAGWQLPTGSNPVPGGNPGWTYDGSDFGVLNASMEANAPSFPGSHSSSYYSSWYPTGAFRGAASGLYELFFASQDDVGRYWTASTDLNELYGRIISIASRYVAGGQGYYYRELGKAVRCVELKNYTPIPYESPNPTVEFGGAPATDVSISADGRTITATTPAYAAGTVDVTIDNHADPIATIPGGFTYVAPMSISGVSPNYGVTAGGEEVVITGANIPSGPTVAFGGVNASNVAVSADGARITATTPAHAVGVVDVTVVGGGVSQTLSGAYTYQAPYVNLSADLKNIQIDAGFSPPSSETYVYGASETNIKTNNPTGYSLSISTDQPSSNSNASDMRRVGANGYITGTANACVWNDTGKVLTNTASPLANNTWGFTLNLTDRDSQKLCRIPSSTSPLKIKSTATDSHEVADLTTIHYGIKLDHSLVAGAYQAKVVYSAVGNV